MDKTYMVRPSELSEKRKAQVRAEERAALAAAKKERNRPLSSKAVDVYMAVNPFVTKKEKEAHQKQAARDIGRRESNYQAARKQVNTPFEARKNVLVRNDTPVKLSKKELDAPIFSSGTTSRSNSKPRKK